MSSKHEQSSGQDPASPAGVSQETSPQSQPKGLWVLFITEMWERFSYYGMRALLVLYLISSTKGDNPGFGWAEGDAYKLYGWYTGLVYLTPIAGGWLADRWLGTHRSLVLGGWIIAAGHVCLALTELFGHGPVDVITLQTAPGPFLSFMAGLALIVIGTGFFKPCVTGMVGQLYSRKDPRRDSGFTIFYMGVNVGSFLSGVGAGTLGEVYGWHWGFGSAAVGMVAGLLCYQSVRGRYLGTIGLPPNRTQPDADKETESPEAQAKRKQEEHERTRPLTRVDWERMAVILIMGLFAISFWAAFEQAGTSLNVFALENTDRTILGMEFPATWYQSANPLIIVLFAPVFASLWVWLDRRGIHPRTPIKFVMGLVLLSLGYIFMVIGALQTAGGNLAGPQWLLFAYLFHTWGELCLSPVALSMVTKLAPQRHTSLMLGLYYACLSMANLLAGYLASFSQKVEAGEVFTVFGGQADFFLVLFVIPFAVSLVLLALSPVIKRMMHGIH